jgi:hypothetical protein
MGCVVGAMDLALLARVRRFLRPNYQKPPRWLRKFCARRSLLICSQGFSRLSERAVMHLRFNVSRMDALTRSLDRGQYPYASSFTAFELVWIPGQTPN